MTRKRLANLLLCCIAPPLIFAGSLRGQTESAAGVDPEIASFIDGVRAVDNHTHVNTTAAEDTESDALPLDALPPFSMPARLDPEGPDWLAALRELYDYPYSDLAEPHAAELAASVERVAGAQGDRFPEWVLDKIGTEVMLANRVAMGPGLAAPRFRWVSYVDALLLPLSTRAERAATPDYEALYPLEERLLARYLADLGLARPPATLDEYLRAVVTPTLEHQRRDGCIAIKFEAAYLRALDFDDVPREVATRVYARYAGGGEPPHADYKALQDFLFHYIASEAGRLGMVVHIHSFEGGGSYYRVAGSDPLLLESAFNDPALRGTNFVILHGGGVFAAHTGAMLWKPNVWTDTSAMAILYPPATLAEVLRGWLVQYPNKVLFGSDAFGVAPGVGWEVTAAVATSTVRRALALALSGMVRNGEISRARAQEIATMVLRTNAASLYGLDLH